MFSTRSLQIQVCSTILLGLLTFTGCGQNSEEAYYLGNEEALRERQREVELEEKDNARATGAPVHSRQSTVADEELRARQGI
ncbi:MAG: hypothetical protein JWM11_2030 [Planctomycetaceae bacterium]|nr:hypothetical protein [Planctomycetaceae bacterium]